MAENSQKIRIKDIAALAGVSEGTVDRVLHNRGDVSEKSREAVNKVLEEMNYSPNLFARSLASKKIYRFVCLFPTFHTGDYWESVEKGFNQAAKEFLHHNVYIEKECFNQFDSQSFINVSESVLKSEPDAVFIAPILEGKVFFGQIFTWKCLLVRFQQGKCFSVRFALGKCFNQSLTGIVF